MAALEQKKAAQDIERQRELYDKKLLAQDKWRELKHTLAVKTLKREQEVEQLAMYLEAIEQESLVTVRAVRQVEGQRRQAQARRELLEDKLDRVRKTATEVPVIAVREPAPEGAEPATVQAT